MVGRGFACVLTPKRRQAKVLTARFKELEEVLAGDVKVRAEGIDPQGAATTVNVATLFNVCRYGSCGHAGTS
jgi:hypothetical protein